MSAQDLETELLENDRDGTAFFVFFGLTLLALALIDRNTGGAAAVVGQVGGQQGSDERLKTDIRRAGQTETGLPLYEYRYIGLPGVYRGVMAQDVARHMPAAVSRHESGFYLVDYDMLGLTLQRIE